MFYGVFDSPGWDYPCANAARTMGRVVGLWYDQKTGMQPYIKLATNAWTFSFMVIAFCNQSIELGMVTHDIKKFAECFPSWLMCELILFKWVMFQINSTKLDQLLRDAESNFLEPKLIEEEKSIAVRYDTRCRNALIVYMSDVIVVCMSYTLNAVFLNMGAEGKGWTLPFRFHVPFINFAQSPEFEIAFVIQICITFTLGICTLCLDSMMFNLVCLVSAQLSIVSLRFHQFTDEYITRIETHNYTNQTAELEEMYSKMKSCIIKHQFLIDYVTRMDDLLSLILLVNVCSGNVGLCFSSYRTLLSEEIFEYVLNLSVSIVVVIQFLTLSSICNDIIDESTQVFISVYNSQWYVLPQNPIGTKAKKNLLPIILRGQSPLALTTAGFANLSMNCFANLITTTLSYLAVLRSTDE